MKNPGFNGYVYYKFSIGYDAVVVDNILDIDNYSMKKNNIKYGLDLLKRFVMAVGFIGLSVRNLISLKRVSMSNHKSSYGK